MIKEPRATKDPGQSFFIQRKEDYHGKEYFEP